MGSWWARLVRPADGEDGISAAKQELKKSILEAFAAQTLGQHLQDIDGWKAFHEFMESEYCGENTKFWLDVEELHLLPDDSVDTCVLRIFEHYFGSTAVDQINLPVHLVRSISTNVEKKNLHRHLFDAAQKRILALMEGSQWHRYPSSTYFDLWIEAKLSNPDSLFVFNTPKPDRKTADGRILSPVTSPTVVRNTPRVLDLEVKEKLCSLLKAKPLHIFLSDPLGYRCFEKYLNTSKIGFEYIEFLNFWNDAEAYKDHPSATLASTIHTKYFVDTDSSGLGVIPLPEVLNENICSGVKADTAAKDLFTISQTHIFNRLKKEAFNKNFFISEAFNEYLETLVALDVALTDDINQNDSNELRAKFAAGHPSDKGLDQSGFQTVLTGALEKNYRSKFRQKKKFVKWATSFFRKYGTSNSGFLSFSEFVTVCQEILKDPKVPYYQIETIQESS